MKVITPSNPVPLAELKQMAQRTFGTLVKAVLDIETETMAVDAELHTDEERHLLEHGSKQEHRL